MLLSSRTAMMSLIAVPVALLANVLAAPAGVTQEATEPVRSLPASQAQIQDADGQQPRLVAQRLDMFSPGRGPAFSSIPAVPRQVLLIDLNPVLDFGGLGQWDSFSQPLNDPAFLNVAPGEATSFSAMPVPPTTAPAFEPAMRAVVLPPRAARSALGNEARSPQMDTASGASPFAAALAPQPLKSSRSEAPVTRVARPAQSPAPPVQRWDAPFPSLGQPQLDRQLRRYLAYLETVGQPDILIVGGQGAVQGVDPLALQESLGDRGYNDLKVFNWGLSDSSAQAVEWLLTELLTPQQLPKLVVWADTSVALNGGRQDSALGKIKASPGYRFLGRGLRPQWSDQEKSIAQKLAQILNNPIPRNLPDPVMALAEAPLDWSAKTKANAKTVKAEQSMVQPMQTVDFANVSETAPAEMAQAAPVLVDSRSRVLPILMPPKPRSSAPASTEANGLENGLTNPAGAQSEAGGFRLVNWCRNASGPCQLQDGQSPSALVQPAAPVWLRQTQAAQEAKKRAAQQAKQRAAQQRANRAASVQARRNPVSSTVNESGLALPDWPQNSASKRFLQAIGFQSVDQRLGSRQAGQPLLRGDQDRDYRNFSLQGDQNRALHRLVQFGQQKGIAIAFVQLPLSQRYLDIERHSREQSFRTYLEVAAQMTPLNLVELPGDGLFWNDALFAKPNHLNRYGAAALSWQIGQAMDGSLLRELR